MPETAYTSEFYEINRSGSRRSASVIVPIVLRLVRAETVVDVGCGDGTWLAVFRELGITDAVGLDGDYVDRRLLQIPQEQFIATDLSSAFGLPRIFDLAISLEVAEHLPPDAAEGFVRSLTQLAPVVLFSAAIPFQDGVHHVNEQWPDYWAALFKRHDYVPIDCVRGKIWANDQVDFYYAQNTLLYARDFRVRSDPALLQEFQKTNPLQLAMVHPKKYLQVAHPGVKAASASLLRSVKRAARWRSRQLRRGGTHA
jgi:SAM-dependent methyltransferase